ncbi:MAG: hypothetical protein AB1756_01440 [Acidobacteriota bacterium]
MKKTVAAVILAFGLVLAASSEYRMERSLEKFPFSYHLLYLPSGKYLRITSMGFSCLMADFIYLWSIQFYSNYEIKDRYRYLEHIYSKIIPDLDPHYLDPFLIGALIMAAETRDTEMALRLLDQGIALNPDRWILAYDAGMYCFQMKDFSRAAYYFEKAMKAPDVHPSIKRMYAGMFERMGNRETAYGYWLEIYRTSHEDEYARNIAWMHVHDLKIEIDLAKINEAIGQFQSKHGRRPARLGDLVTAGFLPEIPLDPNGKEYIYDRKEGIARPATQLILKR